MALEKIAFSTKTDMRYIFLLALITAFPSAFSQTDLYVSDNANTYVYVDGDGFTDDPGISPLYVTNAIELSGSDSYLYLRNEAQLLQGNNLGNSGIGQLSVYQRGTVSNFNYNYWCSPVGNTTANSSINRDFIPENNIFGRDLAAAKPEITSIAANFTTGYDGSASPLEISSRWLYTFNPGAVYAEWDAIGSTGAAEPGFGFTMKGVSGTDGANNTGNNQLYDFRGKPNSGQITIPVLGPIAGERQFTLTGNPYPSAMDAREFFHGSIAGASNQAAIAGTGSGALMFWEQNSASHVLEDYIGGYGLYTIDNVGIVSYMAAPFMTYDGAGNETGSIGSSLNNAPGVDAPGRYLPVGQGFMIEGATDGFITFDNSQRVFYKGTTVGSHFFRNSETEDTTVENNGNELPDNYMRFRIAFDIEHNSEFFSRELLVNMVDYATEGYDYGMEARLPETLPSDLFLVCNDIPFGILAVPFYQERSIPLVAKVESPQTVRFRAYQLQNIPDGMAIYLHDIQNNLYVDLRSQNYEINLPAGNYSNRFEITFTDQTLNTQVVTEADFKIFHDNLQSQLTILNPNGLDVKSVTMFDMAGKQLFEASNLTNDAKYHFTTKSLSEGIYVATLTLGNNEVISKKVIVKN